MSQTRYTLNGGCVYSAGNMPWAELNETKNFEAAKASTAARIKAGLKPVT